MELVSVTVQDYNSEHLRYVPENRSSPRIVTGNWLLKYYKLTTILKR